MDLKETEAKDAVNLLLVDDRADGLLSLEVVLRSPSYNLIKARSGEEALKFLLNNNEDIAVILMDVQMPELDGFETARLVKTQERYKHVPIIFVTGIYGDQRFVNQGYDVGAIDYVTKPYHPYILKSKVHVLCELFRKNREIARLQAEEHSLRLLQTTRQLKDEFDLRERRLISLAESSPDLVAIADKSRKLLYLNSAGRKMVGLNFESEGTRDFLELLPAGDRDRVAQEIWPETLNGGSFEGEFHVVNLQTGVTLPVSVLTFAISDPVNGGIDSVAIVLRDISKEKAAERSLQESEERFRVLANSAPVGIFAMDTEGRVRYVNERWCELASISEEAVKRMDVQQLETLIHPEDRQQVIWQLKSCFDDRHELDTQFRFRDEHDRATWVQMRVVPLKLDSGIRGFIGSCVDMTERILQEEQLRTTADALARTNAELGRFAWAASHDLKEPLRMVSSYVRLLERTYKGKLDPEADEYIRFAVEGTSRMYALVDGILSLTGVESSTDPSSMVDCNRVFEAAVKNLKIFIEETGAIVTRAELPSVTADESQLTQLFQNLISNGIKFSGGARPRLEVMADMVDRDWHFQFRDNGIGIEPQFHDRIFGAFQRLHSQAEYPGTGVGLAICKRIVEKHGGTIWVKSRPGQGSSFYFSVPRLQVRPDNYKKSSSKGAGAYGSTVSTRS